MLPGERGAAPVTVDAVVEPGEGAGPRARVMWTDARRALPPPPSGPMLAVVSPFACLNAGADFCATCVERCPTPGAVRVDGRRVVVDPARCDGCGVCVPLCPAPGGAILLRPAVS